MTPIYRNTWTEQALRDEGWEFAYTFKCKECDDEVSVYTKPNSRTNLFLLPDMTVHPYHRRTDE